MPFFARDIGFIVREVTNHLVNSVHTDGREVIAQRPEVALGVREKTLIDVALNDLALNFKGFFGQIQKVI